MYLHTFSVFFIAISSFILSAVKNQDDFNNSYLDKASKLHYVDIDSAWFYMQKAEQQALNNDNYDSLGLVHAKKGYMYYTIGDYYSSLQAFQKAYSNFYSTNNIEGLSYVINGNGLIFLSQDDRKLAEDSFRQALEMGEMVQDSISIARSLLNLGYALNLDNRINEALSAHEKGLTYLKNYPNHRFVAMIKSQIGYDLIKLKRFDEANDVLSKLLKEHPSINSWDKSFVYSGLAKINIAFGSYEDAYNYALMAYTQAESIIALKDMQRASELVADAAAFLNNYEIAFEYSQINTNLKDSLYSINRNQSLNYNQLLISEAEKKRLQTEYDLAKNQVLFNSAVIIFLLIVAIMLIWATYFYRKTSKKNKKLNIQLAKKNQELERNTEYISNKNNELQKLNDEKIQLISVISHDLKSPFNSMEQLLLLVQDNLLSKEDYLKLNQLLVEQFNKTKELMNEILEWANSQISGIKTVSSKISVSLFFEDVINSLQEQIKNKNITISLPVHENNFCIEADKDQFRIIIQNLLHNAIKFSPENSSINVLYEQNSNEKCIHIVDQGDGIDQKTIDKIVTGKGVLKSSKGTSNETGTGLGLLLVKQFLVNNNGRLSLRSENGKGSTFTLHFPI